MAGLPPHIDLELRLGQEADLKNYTKVLTQSDVDGSSRLLLEREWVEGEVLPGMTQTRAERCRSRDGVMFEFEDVNTNTKHPLVLKKWASNSFVLTTNWNRDFVNRRTLEEGDEIGLSWDAQYSKFYFSLRRKYWHHV
ncbi:hypothetical protein LguiA_034318 [Lonicera macranthoides]